jgi:hypothetical protein
LRERIIRTEITRARRIRPPITLTIGATILVTLELEEDAVEEGGDCTMKVFVMVVVGI